MQWREQPAFCDPQVTAVYFPAPRGNTKPRTSQSWLAGPQWAAHTTGCVHSHHGHPLLATHGAGLGESPKLPWLFMLRGAGVSSLHSLQTESEGRGCISMYACAMCSRGEILLGLSLLCKSTRRFLNERAVMSSGTTRAGRWYPEESYKGGVRKSAAVWCFKQTFPRLWSATTPRWLVPVKLLCPGFPPPPPHRCLWAAFPAVEPSTCTSCLLWSQPMIASHMQVCSPLLSPGNLLPMVTPQQLQCSPMWCATAVSRTTALREHLKWCFPAWFAWPQWNHHTRKVSVVPSSKNVFFLAMVLMNLYLLHAEWCQRVTRSHF